MFLQMESVVMMEREKVLLQADQKMAQLSNSRRDSFLRGRGLSIRLGASLNGITTPRDQGEGEDADLFSGTNDLGDADDLLLDGADESTLLEDFESNFNDKMASFDQDSTPSTKTETHDDMMMFPNVSHVNTESSEKTNTSKLQKPTKTGVQKKTV